MKYVVLGSLGHISKPLAKKLIADGHSVTIVSSNPERAEQITGSAKRVIAGKQGEKNETNGATN